MNRKWKEYSRRVKQVTLSGTNHQMYSKTRTKKSERISCIDGIIQKYRGLWLTVQKRNSAFSFSSSKIRFTTFDLIISFIHILPIHKRCLLRSILSTVSISYREIHLEIREWIEESRLNEWNAFAVGPELDNICKLNLVAKDGRHQKIITKDTYVPLLKCCNQINMPIYDVHELNFIYKRVLKYVRLFISNKPIEIINKLNWFQF